MIFRPELVEGSAARCLPYVAGFAPLEARRSRRAIISGRGVSFRIASSAPAASAPERSSTELSTATGVSGLEALISRTTSVPSPSGSTRSTIARTNGPTSENRRRASSTGGGRGEPPEQELERLREKEVVLDHEYALR